MVFSSTLFLFLFLPGFFLLYSLTPRAFKNYTALAASLAFYAWGAPTFVFYLLGFCLLDYVLARLIAARREIPPWPKILVTVSLVANIGLLVYFKYANFFVTEFNGLLTAAGWKSFAWAEIALPIGISFFVFHKISYTVDVYRGISPPAKSLVDFLLYIVLFPQLIAGPIIRYHDVAEQLRSRRQTLDDFFQGTFRFALGLGKKVLIANVLGEVADKVFNAPVASLPPSQAWLGALCYTFQIYFDFSGYSDMALGLGLMMGFHFRENFNRPYIAESITDFWRRWHISLSSFMREYLYIPLGGNRGSPFRTYANLWIVFLISGIWHGASWTFVFWGIYHGLFLVLDRLFWLKILERMPRALRMLITFVIVVFGWVLFRTSSAEQAGAFVLRMFGGGRVVPPAQPLLWEILASRHVQFTLVTAAVISFIPGSRAIQAWCEAKGKRMSPRMVATAKFALIMPLLLLSIVFLSNARFNPFIYFRF